VPYAGSLLISGSSGIGKSKFRPPDIADFDDRNHWPFRT
jgi:hypothetical protein